MKMIERLKLETRDLHEQIEEENLAKQIMNHSIDEETYKLLLLQNYLAYRETENEIKKFLPHFEAEKHLQLKEDLDSLKVSTERPSKNAIFECHSKAEALGAAYVVEGSALGGMVLAKNLIKCEGLKEIKVHHFFSGDKGSLNTWKCFKEEIEQYAFTEAEELEAINKAKETFQFFGSIFRTEYDLVLNSAFENQGK